MDRELITKTEDFLKQKFDSGLYLSEHPDARPFLETLGLAEERINDICYGIAIHVDDKAGLLHQLLREVGEPAEIKL
jgi:hypothetical protein